MRIRELVSRVAVRRLRVGLALGGLLVAISITSLMAAPSQPVPVIDPEVRSRVSVGPTRVLLELRVQPVSDPTGRADAIAAVQDTVLSRLRQAQVSVTRRYTSIPLLALEIDAAALRTLEMMPDVVVAVRLDGTARPQ